MVQQNVSVYMKTYWRHILKTYNISRKTNQSKKCYDIPLETTQGKENIMYVHLAAGCFSFHH